MASAAMAYVARLGQVSHRFVQQEQVFQPKDTIAIKIGRETVSIFVSEENSFCAIDPTHLPDELACCIYHLVRKEDHTGFLHGTSVYDTRGIAPAMDRPNSNVFNQLFGIEFNFMSNIKPF